jgi:hypothetical protein
MHQSIGTGAFCDRGRCLSVCLASTGVALQGQAPAYKEITFDNAAARLSSARVFRKPVRIFHSCEVKYNRSVWKPTEDAGCFVPISDFYPFHKLGYLCMETIHAVNCIDIRKDVKKKGGGPTVKHTTGVTGLLSISMRYQRFNHGAIHPASFSRCATRIRCS